MKRITVIFFPDLLSLPSLCVARHGPTSLAEARGAGHPGAQARVWTLTTSASDFFVAVTCVLPREPPGTYVFLLSYATLITSKSTL